MSNFFDPRNILKYLAKLSDDEDHVDINNVVETRANNSFHVNYVMHYGRCKELFCKICGGNTFNIGRSEYMTALRCTTCLYEIIIHEI
jgi:hypothetical protein